MPGAEYDRLGVVSVNAFMQSSWPAFFGTGMSRVGCAPRRQEEPVMKGPQHPAMVENQCPEIFVVYARA